MEVVLSGDFYAVNDESYRRITVRSPSKSHMDKFVNIVNNIQRSLSIKVDPIDKYDYVNVRTSKEVIEEFEWYNMPTFEPQQSSNTTPIVYLFLKKNSNKAKQFLDKLDKSGVEITDLPYTWYPSKPKTLNETEGYIWENTKIQPKYPIYIISKGRWEKRYTSRYLEWCNIPYKIVVEESEYEEYAKVIDKSKILVLTLSYLKSQNDKGDGGGIPARNFVLDHSRKSGAKRHWILDDNIQGYTRLLNGERRLTRSGAVFRSIEDYCDRFENVILAGHNYHMFGFSPNLAPYIPNTRVYSSILIDNSIKHRWRGKYNEDTDLSLRVLKDGYPTLLFNHFLAVKLTTLTQKGGNTDSVYSVKNALFLKADSLVKQHPDVAQIKKRFGRIHHLVDYSPFKDNELKYKPNIKNRLTANANNYGLKLIRFADTKSIWRDKKDGSGLDHNECKLMDLDTLRREEEEHIK